VVIAAAVTAAAAVAVAVAVVVVAVAVQEAMLQLPRHQELLRRDILGHLDVEVMTCTCLGAQLMLLMLQLLLLMTILKPGIFLHRMRVRRRDRRLVSVMLIWMTFLTCRNLLNSQDILAIIKRVAGNLPMVTQHRPLQTLQTVHHLHQTVTLLAMLRMNS